MSTTNTDSAVGGTNDSSAKAEPHLERVEELPVDPLSRKLTFFSDHASREIVFSLEQSLTRCMEAEKEALHKYWYACDRFYVADRMYEAVLSVEDVNAEKCEEYENCYVKAQEALAKAAEVLETCKDAHNKALDTLRNAF